jgi:hypothetical protein
MKRSKVTTRKQQLSRDQINIEGEVEYIVRCAAEHDARVITLGPLAFFSTQTGDAWMLDPSDHSALCLARDGDPEPVNITETAESFAVEWNMSYEISGDRFIVTDKAGHSRTIIGYPLREIAQAIRQAHMPGGSASSTGTARHCQATRVVRPGGIQFSAGRVQPASSCLRSVAESLGVGQANGSPRDADN